MGASSLRVGVLFSGGKDSTYTIWVLQHQGWEIPVLVTVQPKRPESFIFHYPGIESTSLQSKALGIDRVLIREETSGLDELQNTLSRVKRDYGIEGGEYESLVVDAPNFKHVIGIEKTREVWDGQSGYVIIEEASLIDKILN